MTQEMRTAADARALLDEVAAEYREILKENLVGIYEHGSLSFGCFSWAVSDIDFLAVVRRELRQDEKEVLIRALLKRREYAPQKGFEMSVVLSEHLKPFVYPTPFELHYSESHLNAVREDLSAYCARMHGCDRDLAAHCTVTRAKGRTVIGEAIERVFGEVPREDYIDSIRFDVENAEKDILENPVYAALNLCRVLAAAKEGLILSKQEGGEWGCEKLDGRWKKLLQGALSAYSGADGLRMNGAEAREFAEYMLGEIEEARKTDRSFVKLQRGRI